MSNLSEKLPLSLTTLQDHLTREPSLVIERLWDSPKALILKIAKELTGKNLLIITGGERENKLLGDLDYFGIENPLEFPAWETLPTEEIDPSSDIVGRRMAILHELARSTTPRVILASVGAILQKVPPKDRLLHEFTVWKPKTKFSFKEVPTFLEALGYRRAPVVTDKGEFAIRGDLVDIFPLSTTDPYRIDFFGDEIEKIRTFDPVSQKSSGEATSISICPASERSLIEGSQTTLFDYIGENTLTLFDDIAAIEEKWVEIKTLLPKGDTSILSIDDVFARAQKGQTLYFTASPLEEISTIEREKSLSGLEPITFESCGRKIKAKRWIHPFIEIKEFFSPFDDAMANSSDELLLGMSGVPSDTTITFITSSEAEETRLKTMLQGLKLPARVHYKTGYLSSGYVLEGENDALFPMTELTHRYRVRRAKWRGTTHTPPSEFHSLADGDLVVHFHHGIGKYHGTQKKDDLTGNIKEYMVIEFAGNNITFIPAEQSYLVSKYIGAGDGKADLSTYGSGHWEKAKLSAQKAILGYAKEMLELNAQRELAGGFAYREDSDELKLFEGEFPFIETDDQTAAISAIKSDMTSPKAMDRLICGDVGYGKTEVAMRAAFKAVADGGKQVAVLVPTTILASQHAESMRARMENFPVVVEELSRFRKPKDIASVIERTREGKVDILVGTHRMIGKDVAFKNLGLVIIDEEQRFGVKVKEKIKAFKAGVDCLTLSATPIPRTLYLSVIGARDISVISTPPHDRLPIKSIIARREPAIIQNALRRELARDGQAFVIHNRVETIYSVAEEIQALVPNASIGIVHGQMHPDDIEDVFHAFKSGTTNILVATSIIENGIDVPNANTIIIDNAAHFGLADLYQIRGRVGRWNKPAYAYFLTPLLTLNNPTTQKRLEAIASASGHGAGLKLAMRDLEIRGGGELLGTKQSGHVASIGFHLYCKLLKKTVLSLKAGKTPHFTETRLDSLFPAFIPEHYVDESAIRLELYHRFGEAPDLSIVDELREELEDRFGKPPVEVEWLYHLTRLRIAASEKRITRLKFEKLTYKLEKQGKNGPLSHTFSMPQTKNPRDFEAAILQVIALV